MKQCDNSSTKMKKATINMLITTVICAQFCACDGKNAPGVSEETSLPALERKITGIKAAEASIILIDMGFVESVNGNEIKYYYPSSLLNPQKQEKAIYEDNMIISVLTDNKNVVSDIEGTEHLSTSEKALLTYKMWYYYLQKQIQNPALHTIFIMEGESIDKSSYFMFGEGTIYDKWKKEQLKQLDSALSLGLITQEEYEQEKTQLSITKQDALKKIESLSADKKFSINELYVEVTDLNNFIGVQTVTNFSNGFESDLMENTLLHAVSAGDIEEAIGDYLLESK